MKTTSSLFNIFLLFIVACTPNQVTATFDASVQGTDCGLPLLDFGSRTAEVDKLVGLPNANKLYHAINLESAYSKAGTNLQVTIRKAATSELRACTAMGPSYLSITVTSAVAK